MFTSTAIDHILSYKWQAVKHWGYLYVVYYMIYMGCIILVRYGRWHMVACWFFIHFVEECMQIFLSIGGFCSFVKEVWNAFDFLRILAMVVFIYYDFHFEEMEESKKLLDVDFT